MQKAEFARVAATFQGAYPDSPAQEYVEIERQIGPRTVMAHGLGYVPPGIKGWEQFAGRLAIPYLNANREPVWFKFRALDDSKAKYAQQEGGERRLFNLQATSARATTLVLCEGEFDVITLTGLGLPAVGIPGAKGWKKHWSRVLQGWDRMVFFYDNDEPGRDLVKAVKAAFPDVVALQSPGMHHDINEAFRAGLGQTIRALALGLEQQEDAHEHDGAIERQTAAVEEGGSADEPGPGDSGHSGDGDPSGWDGAGDHQEAINGFDGISNPDARIPF